MGYRIHPNHIAVPLGQLIRGTKRMSHHVHIRYAEVPDIDDCKAMQDEDLAWRYDISTYVVWTVIQKVAMFDRMSSKR